MAIKQEAQDEVQDSQAVEANTAGYEANMDGFFLASNPHPAGSSLFRAWEAGWLQGYDAKMEWLDGMRA